MNRYIDFILALILAVLLAPAMLAVAILVLTTLGRPVIFKQKRTGLNNRSFEIVKFRTMKNMTDGNNILLSDEERTTKVGNLLRSLSIDELPELWNVLKGEMSLVGPRPLLVEYLPFYTPAQIRRHQVRPGITGWAQVNGRNNIDWDEKFELDLWYIDNKTLLLDLKIILLTIVKVLRREGINSPGQSTVRPLSNKKQKFGSR